MMRVLLAVAAVAAAVQLREAVEANPIRRIVNMLQKMQEEIKAEGKKEEKLYEKFYCYCENGASTLQKDIAAGGEEAKELAAEIEQKSARKEQLDQEVDQHRKDREEAKAAIEKATGIRNKEKADYDKQTGDFKQNLAAMNKAIDVLGKGLGGAFLQVPQQVSALKHAVERSSGVFDMERDQVMAFLEQKSEGAGSTGEIVGIIKAMKDEMDKDLGGAIEGEEQAAKAFSELMQAKNEVIESATKNIEKKVVRSGELAVEVTEAKNAMGNNEKEIAADREFLANMDQSCKDKAKEFEERNKDRAEELLAISEAVKVLNDDDALDIFKKTMPSPGQAPGGVALIQTTLPVAAQALAILDGARAVSHGKTAPQLALLTFMLRTGKVDFSKVFKMVDEMIAHLGQEQKDDDDQLNYCNTELNNQGDKKVSLERDINDLNKQVDSLKAAIEEHEAEIEELKSRIAETEKMMTEATEQREEENKDYMSNKMMNTAAKQLVEKAKNRLQKFYNPALYKPPPVRELTEEERIAQNMGEVLPTEAPQYIAGTKITVNMQLKSRKDPGPAPETFSGERQKSKKSSGVIGLMDMCLKDLDQQMQQAELEENTAQNDYETLIADAKKSVEEDTAAKTGAETALAEANGDLQQAKSDRKGKGDELLTTNEVIKNLHGECDFLVENFDFRKEARTNEIEALKNAKAVLSGADFS